MNKAESTIDGAFVDIYWPSHLGVVSQRAELLYLIEKPMAEASACNIRSPWCPVSIQCTVNQPHNVNTYGLAVGNYHRIDRFWISKICNIQIDRSQLRQNGEPTKRFKRSNEATNETNNSNHILSFLVNKIQNDYATKTLTYIDAEKLLETSRPVG